MIVSPRVLAAHVDQAAPRRRLSIRPRPPARWGISFKMAALLSALTGIFGFVMGTSLSRILSCG